MIEGQPGRPPDIDELDRARLLEALTLARTSFGLTEPNPRVGCVLADQSGRLIGVGATQAAGSAHAEVMALRDARVKGASPEGASAWVTLEPCSHTGRTPPCCDALIEARIARCVIALRDPFPAVAGSGIERLRQAGIRVDVLAVDDPLALEARDINVGFLSRIERGRPWLRAKLAASADGRVALEDGSSKWITGQAARDDGHRWRQRASAVLTGIGTVLADNPRLDVRAVATLQQPLRIVLDSRLRLPVDAALMQAPGRVLVVSGGGHVEAAERLRAAGAEVWDEWPGGNMPALQALMARLGERGLNEVHLEAGPTLTGAFMDAGLVDEWLLYMAPTMLGPGMGMVRSTALASLDLARRCRWHSAVAVGDDLRLRLLA